MTPTSEVDTAPQKRDDATEPLNRYLEDEDLDELPDEVEMSLFDHLDELRRRIFLSLIAVVLGILTTRLAPVLVPLPALGPAG